MAKQPKPPKNKALDAKVLARRQKDLDGYLLRYQDILDKRTEKYAQEINQLWQRIGRNITNEIRAIYKELQDANGVPIEESPIDAAKYRNMQRQLARLTKMQDQLIQMMGTDEQKAKLSRNLQFSYTDSYYFNAFALEQAAKVAINVPTLTGGQVLGAVMNPWLPDGNTYSDRIRANTHYLAGKMQKAVENAVGNGWSINRTARHIQQIAGEGYYNAVRLARTEINRAASIGATHCYIQNADILDGKRWNATLDSRTAPKDAANDGDIFDVDYDTPENPAPAGKRIPNHPNCRCKYSPVLSALGVSTKERIARGDGDTPKNFGERIYTKARTYKEYAQERGLPDMDEQLRNDDPKRYLRRGEGVEAYDIKAHVWKAVGGVAAGAAAAKKPTKKKEPPASGFVEAKTIKEANEWAKNNIPVDAVDYKGFDIKLANEINKELNDLFTAYPEVEDINFIGTGQERNRRMYEWEKQQFLERNKELFGDLNEKTKEMMVKRYVKRRTISGNTYAQAANKTWGPQAGISFNEKWAKDYKAYQKSKENGVKLGWNPPGCDKPVSTLVHEFGHSLDYFIEKVGLRDKYLKPIFAEALKDPEKTKKELSRYAIEGKNPDREIIAEAFAEYRLNPKPRKWAKQIGKAIEDALNEYRKGRK